MFAVRISRSVPFAVLALELSVPLAFRGATRFYADDPVEKDPPPVTISKVKSRALSDYYDVLKNTFYRLGERNTRSRFLRAKSVNTLGEVPDSPWYTNRIGKRSMTAEELVRGPGNENGISFAAPWTIVAPKSEGVTPGFLVRDSSGRFYQLKFDPITNPEMATAAEMISSRFFYALGYNVHESWIVHFRRGQLEVGRGTKLTDRFGKRRAMRERDVTELLLNAPSDEEGQYRAIVNLYFEGKPVGPFRYYGTRSDDPNDVIPHEHRRELRGLMVFCAWLDHDDSRAINTLDMLVEQNGTRFLKHHLIDFGSTLGAASDRPNSPREGNAYLFAWKPVAIQFFSLGGYVPPWARVHYPKLPSVGRFEWQFFDPEKWVPQYPNPVFANCLPDDAFWAAKQVMAFTDDKIRAVVKVGEYSDPEAEKWIADCLIGRRDKIGRTYFAKVLPLDHFAVCDGRLAFEDLSAKYKLAAPGEYTFRWSKFDNDTGQRTPLSGETSAKLPLALNESPSGAYFAVGIAAGDEQKTVTVYLRKTADHVQVVGIDRTW
jgi:hypothetical protein